MVPTVSPPLLTEWEGERTFIDCFLMGTVLTRRARRKQEEAENAARSTDGSSTGQTNTVSDEENAGSDDDVVEIFPEENGNQASINDNSQGTLVNSSDANPTTVTTTTHQSQLSVIPQVGQAIPMIVPTAEDEATLAEIRSAERKLLQRMHEIHAQNKPAQNDQPEGSEKSLPSSEKAVATDSTTLPYDLVVAIDVFGGKELDPGLPTSFPFYCPAQRPEQHMQRFVEKPFFFPTLPQLLSLFQDERPRSRASLTD